MNDSMGEAVPQQVSDGEVEELDEDDAAGEELGGTGIELIAAAPSTVEMGF